MTNELRKLFEKWEELAPNECKHNISSLAHFHIGKRLIDTNHLERDDYNYIQLILQDIISNRDWYFEIQYRRTDFTASVKYFNNTANGNSPAAVLLSAYLVALLGDKE